MAENDTHYNGVMNGNHEESEPAANSGAEPVIPLPNPGEGGPVYPGNDSSSIPVIPLPNPGEGGPVYPGNDSSSIPVIPLPNPGEGGPVYPGNGSGSEPVIPLPNPGEGGPVYPGNDSSSIPVIPLPNPGEGGPVYPGNDSSSIPVIPLPNPGEGGPVYPGNCNNSGGCTWLPSFPPLPGPPSVSPQYFGQVRFLNASTNTFAVDIYIDSTNYAANSRFGSVSNYDWIADGFHTVTVRRANGMRNILLQQNFPFVANQKVTMVLTDSAAGGLEMIRIIDTGCNNLPSRSGCYRFANMAYSGSSFDLFLTGGETVFHNVNFQTVTSYKQAVAGSYQFYVTDSNNYTFMHELPIIVIGAIATGSNVRQPLVSFSVNINAGRNYTSYIIGNTWSGCGLRVLTVED